MKDLFEDKTLSPMLIGAEGEPFDSYDHIFELKMDGVRCLAYLSGKTELVNKRSLLVSPIYPELSRMHRQVKGHCILDGELIVISKGKPDFSEIQRRALMGNRTKIGMAAKALPVSYVAFDILYLNAENLTGRPLTERKGILSDTVKENDRLAVSRVIEFNGTALFRLTEQQDLEGVVAKRKDSQYYFGKRTKEWIKVKNLKDEDFVVCGYIRKSEGVTSLVLGQYRNGKLVYKGHVTLGVSGSNFRRILEQELREHPPFIPPPGNENAVWRSPTVVCTVKYMEKNESGSLRQPVFKGLREDKAPEECVEQ